LRVAPEDELEGLDIPEMGVLAYPDQQLVRGELDYDSEDNAPIKQLVRFGRKGLIEKTYETPIAQAIPVIQTTAVETAPAAPRTGPKFTKVEILCKQSRFEALKEAMSKIGITGMTVTQVLGYGVQGGKTEFYRGVETETNLLPKVQVSIVVSKVPVRTVIETAKKVLYTGHIGDGKIFVYDVENVVKVRTGEEGYDALQDVE
jgi:Amt family ammonium transporter